eukprot:TRINITY_DN907_c0_g1_i1.p1 TRINITY_DN907_c0_g1~~TRINITY_DN907_c0_g1_i1.p1  ORF type:complete len:479 (-),score=152.38 TRINITY_DN907_c0_g1_i1:35-1450(-)
MKAALLLLGLIGLSIQSSFPLTSLPGYNGKIGEQYTGYITVSKDDGGRNLFYWYVKTTSSNPNAPLVFWYQGGPGCSGLGGLFTEHGPFVPTTSGGLEDNPLSWHQWANMVYLESPAGVGFSYVQDGNPNTGDNQTASDNFNFIEGFLKTYPDVVGKSIYLTGESYGGVYIPTLANQIINHPESLTYKYFAGLAAGNPVFSCQSANYNDIQMKLFYWHALVSPAVYYNWTGAGCEDINNSGNDVCQNILTTAVNQIGVIDQQLKRQPANQQPSLDPDNLYQDFCTGNGSLTFVEDTGYPNSCSPLGDLLTNYLNRPDVQSAINAQPTTWSICSDSINYDASGASMVPYYENLFKYAPHLNILIYSGDVDIYTVPFGYTWACTREFQQSVVNAWQPYFVNGATAGYYEVYQQYTLATIKGAGHEAPEYQPLSAYNLISNFALGTLGKNQGGMRGASSRITQGSILRNMGIRV